MVKMVKLDREGFRMTNYKWIFFDIGSTLINEEKAYQDRIEQLQEQISLMMHFISGCYSHLKRGKREI